MDLRVEQVSKSFSLGERRLDVLREINLVVPAGQRLGVVGVSGVGKSTLLHILGTLERPTTGRIFYGEREVSAEGDETLAEFRNRTLGFAFQFHHLLAEFTALENTMLPALIAGKPKKEASDIAAELLTRMGLGERLHHRPKELSGGEQQRVALSRALVLRPPVLLADEPTGNLDTRTADEIHEELVRLNEELGVTMIVVTHSSQLAARMHRAVTLYEGMIQEVDQGAAGR